MTISQLFKMAHALTKKIRKMGDDYRLTFGACLKYIRATEGKFVRLSGKTYNCRDLIKSVGGTFDAASKTWRLAVREWHRISRMDAGRATWGVVATAETATLKGDWRTNPAFGYAE